MGLSSDLFGFDTEGKDNKSKKIKKWGYIEVRRFLLLIEVRIFCTIKETIDKMKRKLTKWEKVFENRVGHK